MRNEVETPNEYSPDQLASVQPAPIQPKQTRPAPIQNVIPAKIKHVNVFNIFYKKIV